MILAENGGGFKIIIEVNGILDSVIAERCNDDPQCSAYYGLCFTESSEILLCDENDEATDEVYVPKDENRVKDLGLIGDAFYMEERPDDMCYISGTILERIDG